MRSALCAFEVSSLTIHSLEYNLCEAAGESWEVVAERFAFKPVRKRLVNPLSLAGNFADDDVCAGVGIVKIIVSAEFDWKNFAMQKHTHIGGSVVRINRNGLDIAKALDQFVILDKGFHRLVT